MYRYSCLSLCSKTRSRYVQIIEVVDYLKPVQCSISCRQKVICFCFLLCLCGPVCFWDCSCLHCVTAVIECRVWAWTLLLLSFPVLPPLTSPPPSPGGFLEVYRAVILPMSPLKQKHEQVTHNSSCFSFQTATTWVPCGYTFEKKTEYFLLCKEHSPKTQVFF